MTDTDIIHKFGSEAEWNESFYFNFYDRHSEVCGFMRIGLKPNKKEKSMFCFFMLPDGALVGNKDTAPYDDARLSVKGLKFKKIRAEKLWKMSFTGLMARMSTGGMAPEAVTFSLSFETLNTVFD